MDIDMIGPAIVLGLGCIGTAVGCAIGGMASIGVMSRVEENHGKFITMAVLTSTQFFYALLLMFMMKAAIAAKTLSAAAAIGIGASVGLTIMIASIYQGICAASGIQAVAKQPSVFGKCVVILGIIESLSLFAFVFARLLIS